MEPKDTPILNGYRRPFSSFNWSQVADYLRCSARQVDERTWEFRAAPGVWGPQATCFEITDNGGEFNVTEVIRVSLPRFNPTSLPYDAAGPRLSNTDQACRISLLLQGRVAEIDWEKRFGDP